MEEEDLALGVEDRVSEVEVTIEEEAEGTTEGIIDDFNNNYCATKLLIYKILTIIAIWL